MKINPLNIMKKPIFFIILCLTLLIFLVFKLIPKEKPLSYKLEDIASFKISAKNIINLKVYSDYYNLDFVELLTYYALENNFFQEKSSLDLKLQDNFKKKYKYLVKKYKKTNYLTYYNYFNNILNEITCFPILLNTYTKSSYSYSDSWGAERTYGGKRPHLGTDIMSKENISGIIPIVSMTNGIIENLGWNEKGGYRVGIRTEQGNYYYYAHLSKFSENIKIGMNIESGALLGYMGDTGYSKIEGTIGNFPVHLHLGIEVTSPFLKTPLWINPYPFISLIEYLNLNT